MLADGRFYMDTAPLMVAAPGIAITLTVFLALKLSHWLSGRDFQPSGFR
jgi:ABC-type dipeptide/oligopeptide/nickel transport system permease subunit